MSTVQSIKPAAHPRHLLRDALLLIALGTILGLSANALRPDGLPLGKSWQLTRLTRQAASAVQPIDLTTALKLYQNGALFIDSREAWEFQEGRIPGAASLPLEALDNAIASAPEADRGIPVIVYCGSQECGKAELLAQSLAKRGLDVRYLPDGLQGWLIQGGPVEMP